MRPSSIIAALGMVALLLLAAGCRPADGQAAPAGDDGMRIVSLSPAISRTLVDLDLQEHIVGRTPFCESLDRAIPVVGDLLNLDYESLVRLRPTHVLVQPPAAGIDRNLLRIAEQHGWLLGMWRLDDVDDITRMLDELPGVLGDHDAAGRASALRNQVTSAMRREHDQTFTGRTLLIVGIDPITVFGRGTYLHELLLAAGAHNAVELNQYPQLTLEDVTRINPEAMILVRPSASGDPRTAMGALARLDIAAVRDGRLAVLSHPDAFMPSSAIVGVVDALRVILHQFANMEAPSP